jgi:hypothetical protein
MKLQFYRGQIIKREGVNNMLNNMKFYWGKERSRAKGSIIRGERLLFKEG